MALRVLAVLLLTLPAFASTQGTAACQAPQHTSRNSPFFLVPNEAELARAPMRGMQIERAASPRTSWPSIAS